MKHHHPKEKKAREARPGRPTSHSSHITQPSHEPAASAEVLENIKGLLA